MTPTIVAASWYIVPPLGISLIISFVTARATAELCTSMSGVSAVTSTVSVTPPTCNSPFTWAVKFASISMPSRFVVRKPGRVNVTL